MPADGEPMALVGCVIGVRLVDGRGVVVKVHGPRTSAEFLAAVQIAQRRLRAAGFPAPEPLLAPRALGAPARAHVTIESLIGDGGPFDPREPGTRALIAGTLARLVEILRPLNGLEELRDHMMLSEWADTDLWPRPHDDRLDFGATTAGAEWIDAIARAARGDAGAADVGDVVVGHTDWRAEHLRIVAGCVTAVYDWDSLTVTLEPAMVGSAAHAFTVDWASDPEPRFPSLDDALGFLADYERHRAAPFDDAERASARASLAYTMAYTARCEHSDACTDRGRRPPRPPAGPTLPPGSARAFLAAHGAELLADRRR